MSISLRKVSVRDAIASGVAATFAISVIMVMKNATHHVPEVHIAQTLAMFVGSDHVLVGWAIHLFIGVVLWSLMFALFAPSLPGRSYVIKGAIFGAMVWLAMMVLYMPLAGAGLFGLHRGIAAPIMTLVMHLVYGVVLSGVYGMGTTPGPVRSSGRA
jgi:hypothetical protein